MLLTRVMRQPSHLWALRQSRCPPSSEHPEELAWGKAERQGRQAHTGAVLFGAALPRSGNLEYLRVILSEACGATHARNCCLLMK